MIGRWRDVERRGICCGRRAKRTKQFRGEISFLDRCDWVGAEFGRFNLSVNRGGILQSTGVRTNLLDQDISIPYWIVIQIEFHPNDVSYYQQSIGFVNENEVDERDMCLTRSTSYSTITQIHASH